MTPLIQITGAVQPVMKCNQHHTFMPLKVLVSGNEADRVSTGTIHSADYAAPARI